jgi:uncharacterized membrane protein YoaT (DUF817 family)
MPFYPYIKISDMTDPILAFIDTHFHSTKPARMFAFLLKQAWAAVFGIAFLAAIITTHMIWHDDWGAITRNDTLFLFAISSQALLLATRLETWAEAKVIFLFHITGTVMEIFKLQMGSWDYPGDGIAEIMGVPLFTGFMYAAIGSYIARVIRIFDIKFAPYPPLWVTFLLAALIYGNFFTHHFLPDIRIGLFIATVLVFGRVWIWSGIGMKKRWCPLPVAAFLAAFCVWIAENVGTFTQTWVYAGQGAFDLVSFGKLGSWYLLVYVSFVTVTLVTRDSLLRKSSLSPDRDNA